MDHAQQPLCFGAVTCFSVDSDRCGECAVKSDCSAVVAATRQTLIEKFGLKEAIEAHEKQKAKKPRIKPKLDETRPRAKETPGSVVPPARAIPIALVPAIQAASADLTAVENPVVIRASLAKKVNPFPKAKVDFWLMGELLVNNIATPKNIDASMKRVCVSDARIMGVKTAFSNLKIATMQGDRYIVCKE